MELVTNDERIAYTVNWRIELGESNWLDCDGIFVLKGFNFFFPFFLRWQENIILLIFLSRLAVN